MKRMKPLEFAIMAIDGPVSFVTTTETRITYTPAEYRKPDLGYGACLAECWNTFTFPVIPVEDDIERARR